MEKEKKSLTREQMVQWYKDEIELAELRAQLSKLQRDAMVSEAERMQAIAVIAQITRPPEGNENKEGESDGDKEITEEDKA
jgi:hypothetical protein